MMSTQATEHSKALSENSSEKKVISIENLKLSFGEQEVLKDVSLHLNQNENLVVLGKSGTGKSVLVKCIVRLITPQEGKIEVFDKEVLSLNSLELDELRKKIGFMFQSGALYDSMTVRQNLEFPLRRMKKDLSEDEIESKIKEALENVGLADSIDKMPSQLSGGMRKRISLARTVVVDPEVMLYDEPTAGLDPVTSTEISSLIVEIQKKYKTSSIIITHDLKSAQIIANRVLMIEGGVVHSEGSMSEFEKSTDSVIQKFFM